METVTMPDTSVAGRLHDHLAPQQDRVLALLEELVAIESPSTGREGTRRVLERLADELAPLDFRCRLRPGRETGGQLVALPRRRQAGAPANPSAAAAG